MTSWSIQKITLIFALLMLGAHASAQTYPSKPVSVVVPYAVGGTTDIVARLVSQELGKTLNGVVVVENRAGAGGVVGWSSVAKAAPDGYSVLTIESSYAISMALGVKMPFDPHTAFKQVATATSVPYVLVVNPSVPAKTVQELISLVKKEPGKFFYGSGGNGTNTHLAAELFNAQAGIKIAHVPYKGAGAVLNDLIGGQIQVLVTALPTALPHIKSGKLKALMVTDEVRSPVLPEVPSAKESGLPGMVTKFWVGFAVPAQTPDAIVDQLSQAVIRAVNIPEVKNRIVELGLTVEAKGPVYATKLLNEDYGVWSKIIKDADIKLE